MTAGPTTSTHGAPVVGARGALLDLRPPRTGPEWDSVAVMMAEYFQWLAASAHLDHVADAQPGADEELADPQRFFGGRDRHLVVAWHGPTPLGMAGMVGHDDGSAELVRVYTRPDARGHGLGTALVRRAVACAATRGFATVQLETSTHFMGDAIRVYERLGFEPVVEAPTIAVDGVVRYRLAL